MIRKTCTDGWMVLSYLSRMYVGGFYCLNRAYFGALWNLARGKKIY